MTNLSTEENNVNPDKTAPTLFEQEASKTLGSIRNPMA